MSIIKNTFGLRRDIGVSKVSRIMTGPEIVGEILLAQVGSKNAQNLARLNFDYKQSCPRALLTDR